MFDKYYTDSRLASILVSLVPKDFEPVVVADFASGQGSLLKAAKEKWKDLEIVANDYCSETASELKNNHWSVYNLDFLKTEQVTNSGISKYHQNVDLILLNPPFNQDEVRLLHWNNCTEKIQSSISLSFVYYSMAFLKENGYLVAILPNGCLSSDRDKEAIIFLSKIYQLEVVEDFCDSKFKDVSPRISIVRLKKARPSSVPLYSSSEHIPSNKVKVIRGKMHMFKAKHNDDKLSYPLVHTTDLKNALVNINENFRVKSEHIIIGPALLIPRVGNFSQDKISYLSTGTEIVMSDCLFAVLCSSEIHAEELRSFIIEDWRNFKKIYNGTGAVYTTLVKITTYISKVVEHH
ncbi:N-6 DNA methylase [Psychrobacter sp. H8-1]|uniref:N-6 DNA methylase n=1 Tax=Psychrobacter sp. H8-1 TaxID=2774129 RepID=UPI00191A326B|nr:N-6 DNA methylase [Psychrobacter sp. H8-1]